MNALWEASIRAALLALAVGIALKVCRIRSARLRHRAWSAVTAVMLTLPVWVAWGPAVSFPILTSAEAVTGLIPEVTAAPSERTVSNGASVAPGDRWPSIALVAVYLCGVSVFLLRLVRGSLAVRALLRDSYEAEGLLVNPKCVSPVAAGWFRPRIVVPLNWRAWSDDDRRTILIHEEEHIRRRDPLVQWVAVLNRSIFWFHPLAWWLERSVAELAEHACDCAVLGRGLSPQEYSAQLIRLARGMSSTHFEPAASPAAGTHLTRRVHSILQGVATGPDSAFRRATATAVLIAAVVVFGWGRPVQAQPAHLSFDAASIRPNPTRNARGFRVHPGGVDIAGVNVMYLISQAYQIPIPRIVAPKDAENTLRAEFDVHATAGRRASRNELMTMLQSLLEERCKLRVRREMRPGPVYQLVVAKSGAKLRESTAEFEEGNPMMGLDTITAQGSSMARLAFLLSARLGRAVFDQTGLTKLYDYGLRVTSLEDVPHDADGKRSAEYWTGSTVFKDIQDQLGLVLEPGRADVEYLVIESVSRPSEN